MSFLRQVCRTLPVVLASLAFCLVVHAETVEVSPQVQIYYESVGQGTPLLFVPGWTMTTGVWREQVSAFSKTHRVIVMDPRCHGNSSKTLSCNTLSQHARDVRRLMEVLQLNQVTLVGWSMGVGTILEYVNQFGCDRLAGLVLVDGSPCYLKKEDWSLGLPLDEIYKELSSCENQRITQIDRFIDGMFKSNRPESELEWLVKESSRTPTSVATVLLCDWKLSDRRPYLSKVSVPTLIAAIPENKDIAEFMKSKISESRLTVFEGVGDALFMEDPKRFNESLGAFLKSLP